MGRSDGGVKVTSFPLMNTLPWSGDLNPDIVVKSVDFPPPEGPIMATFLPDSILKFAVRLNVPWLNLILSNVMLKLASSIKNPEK